MEKFVEISGYNGVYEISSFGNVISNNFGKRKVLKYGLMNSGYKMVSLKKDCKQKMCSIHRLVAIAFLPNENNLPQVNHKDGNKLNNNLDNLEWCTRSENIKHMYNNGLKTYKPLHYKGKFGAEHNRSKKVLCINDGVTFGSMSEAERFYSLGQGGVCWSIKNKKPIKGKQFQYEGGK
jgi:hypothetical protein